MQHGRAHHHRSIELQNYRWTKSASVWNHNGQIQIQSNHSSHPQTQTCQWSIHQNQSGQKPFNILQQSSSQCQTHPRHVHRIPLIGISSAGANCMWQQLQENPPNTPTPINLKGTHLSEKLGKYMVTTPLSCITVVKAHVEILLSKDPSLHLDDELPMGPMLQERRRAPNQNPEDKDDHSTMSLDPCMSE